MIEIERKFTLKNTTFLSSYLQSYKITQGYLNSSPERTVRVRTKNNKAYITIKGKSSHDGMTRFEWEKEIALDEAMQLLALCEKYIIEKTRYEILHEGKIFEIDVFEGLNKGLIIAEVELLDSTEKINLPDWIDCEVTGDERYYNSYLSNKPFSQWVKE